MPVGGLRACAAQTSLVTSFMTTFDRRNGQENANVLILEELAIETRRMPPTRISSMTRAHVDS